jgi:endonuclease G
VQDYDFNSASWGTLENKVRTKVCADTLFVVVGTLFENNKTISKSGRTISVPSHCFKMLLRTKSGNTKKNIADIKSADELMCIGFIFQNNGTGATTSLKDAAVSVAEIEERSGFKFYRNLDPAIADKVKSQCNFSEWSF